MSRIVSAAGRLFRGHNRQFCRQKLVKCLQTQQTQDRLGERLPLRPTQMLNIKDMLNDDVTYLDVQAAHKGLNTNLDSWHTDRLDSTSRRFIQQAHSAAAVFNQKQPNLHDNNGHRRSNWTTIGPTQIDHDHRTPGAINADNWEQIRSSVPEHKEEQETPHLLPERLPVPPLHQTLYRYLQSIQSLTTTEEFEHTKWIVEEFAQPGGVGERLQKGLLKRYKEKENWLYDWFIDANYLKVRRPFTIYTPGAIIPRQNFHGEEGQLQYAAKLIAGVLDFKSFIDKSQIPCDMQNGNPLCMDQYYKFFGACRVPGVEKDGIYPKGNNSEAKHIVVACNNHFFSLDVYDTQGNPLSVDDLYHQLNKIKMDSAEAGVPLGVMTTEHRDTWGKVYTELSQDPTNRQSFHAIHGSILVVCLDKPVPEQGNVLADSARRSMYGGGSQLNSGNRWYDKIVQLFVGVDGYVGAAYERSRSEGIVRAKMLDHALTYARKEHTFPVMTSSTSSSHIPHPQKLTFIIDEDSLRVVESAGKAVDKFANELQVTSFSFSTFGKSFIKSIGFSPDAFMQMAMQLTHFKLYAKSRATYETASLRKFHHGRTEIIRSASNASHKFVKSMCDGTKSPADRFHLLEAAINSHKQYTNWALNGNAIDRHLLGLRMMAQESGEAVPELFADKSYKDSVDFKIVSSQVLLKNAFGMCYAPKVSDGYSVCYNPKEDDVYFSITSFRSCQETDADIFASCLVESLHQMQTLAESIVSTDEITVAVSI